jgi:hypothetical protein
MSFAGCLVGRTRTRDPAPSRTIPQVGREYSVAGSWLHTYVAHCARMMVRIFIAVANEVLKKLSKNYKSFAVEELLANRFVVASGL